MKRIKRKGYFVLFLIFAMLELAWLIHTICHPRPHNFLLCLHGCIFLVLSLSYAYREYKKKLPGAFLTLAAYLLTLYAVYFGGTFIDVAYPYHMKYEYQGDMAKCKASAYDDYSFFPDTIPQEAKHVKWLMRPSLLQGNGMELLMLYAPETYIDAVISAYADAASVCGVEEEMDFKSFYDRERIDKLTVYKLYDNEDGNHTHIGGFFVDREREVIGYFCQ